MATNISFFGQFHQCRFAAATRAKRNADQLAAGKFVADWYDPLTGANAGYTQAVTTNGGLPLPLPDFSEDLAGVVHPPPTLTALNVEPSGGFELRLNSETGGNYLIQKSTNLSIWQDFEPMTNDTGTLLLFDPVTSQEAFPARPRIGKGATE